ncbi:MAG: adenylate/guanylate cyclase domain-containing protein [Reyranellaceae bacterium]
MTGREQRRLAAIVAADVVGYSRLMGRDEAGTVARLRQVRAELLQPVLDRRGGRIVKLTGDGALLEFGSAVEALSAAIEFQQAMAESEAERPEAERLVFRIGLHLGDLIVEGDDLYGDGVNVAARLEAEAPPGGITISGAVHEATAGRIKATFDDLGILALKNIDRPMQAHKVRWEIADWPVMTAEMAEGQQTDRQGAADAPTLPDKPSIAVLPFQNLSGDREQEYFTDGITEDIITELSRFHSLFVIARNSSFSYKGKYADLKQVSKELGVRYLLDGSIRKSGDRVRVTSHLTDALSQTPVWAERYDRNVGDIFAVQEEITSAIVGAIALQIDLTERQRATRLRPASLSAYELALRAWAHQLEARDRSDPHLIDQAIAEAKRALAIDPGCIRALHALARAHGSALFLRVAPDRDHAIREAQWAAAHAIELDPTDALGYGLRGIGAILGGELDRYPDALADARRAHDINPNDAFILRILGDLEAGIGEYQRAIEHLNRVLRLSPRDPHSHLTHSALAFASFGAKQYEDGIRSSRLAINDKPTMLPPRANLAVCLIGAGEVETAKAAFKAGQELSPEFFKVRLEGNWQYARPEDRSRATTFLRIAAGLEDASAAELLR